MKKKFKKDMIQEVVEFIVLARREWTAWNGNHPTTLSDFKAVATDYLKDSPDDEMFLFILTIADDDELEKILLLA